LAGAIKEAAGITADDAPEAARERLAELVQAAMGVEETGDAVERVGRHLALLTGLDTELDRVAGSADQRVLHASTRRFLEALARRQPLCLMVEDIHWADDALLDLLELVAGRAHEAPL